MKMKIRIKKKGIEIKINTKIKCNKIRNNSKYKE